IAPSERSRTTTKNLPMPMPHGAQPPANLSARSAFIGLSPMGSTWRSRYDRRMPPAVMGSDVAMSTKGRLPGWAPGPPLLAQTVRDRRDAGVGRAAQRVGAEEDGDQREAAHAVRDEVMVQPLAHLGRDLAGLAAARQDAAGDEDDVRDDEEEEDRRQDLHRFL